MANMQDANQRVLAKAGRVDERTTTRDAATPAIEITKLTKRFGGFTAVDDLSLTVHRGEIFGLLGPNGSGKTTTINVVSGLSKPTFGEVRVLGYDITRDTRAVRAVLGSVPQETALYEELSAWANMTLHADLYGVPRAQRDDKITKLLRLVQLEDRKASRVGAFSGGMKRRLAMARALLHDPQLIELDEPTLGVDVQSRRALWDYIHDLKAQGKTVLITTNYLEEANALCDRLAILDHGKLVAMDTPANLKRTYGDTIISVETLASISANLLADLRSLTGITRVEQHDRGLDVTVTGEHAVSGRLVTMLSRETEITTISQREPNLDDIFLRLTGAALRD